MTNSTTTTNELIILETPDGSYDAYEISELASNGFESFDDLNFVQTLPALPEDAVRILEGEPAGPDYDRAYRVETSSEDETVETLTGEGHDQDAVLVYIDQMVTETVMELPQPDEGWRFTPGEVEVLRQQLTSGSDEDEADKPVIGVTCDMGWDLAQVVDLPEDDEARQLVVDHFGEIWASHVRRLAAERGYDAEAYWGADEARAHDVRTRTPVGDGEQTIEQVLFQAAHDAFGVDQGDVDRVAAEVAR